MSHGETTPDWEHIQQEKQHFEDNSAVYANLFAVPSRAGLDKMVLRSSVPPPAKTPSLSPDEASVQDLTQGCAALRELIADYGASVVWQDVVMAVYAEYKDVVERHTGWRPTETK
jgi:hypothetical protein